MSEPQKPEGARRTGKVARLPFVLRTRVNEALRDGVTYPVIIDMVLKETNGLVGLNDQNVTNWKDGGHKDWLKEQERFEDLRFESELSLQMAKLARETGASVHEANLFRAAGHLSGLLDLTQQERHTLKEKQKDDPEFFLAVINATARLGKPALEFEKFRNQVRDALSAPEMQKLRDPKSDLSDSDRAAIVSKVDEILGLK